MKLYCKNCDNLVEVSKFTIKVVDGKVFNPESVCACGEEMADVTPFQGFGGIIKKPGGTVSKKF